VTFTEIMACELGSKVQLQDGIDDAAIDSLEYLEFVLHVEKEFGVKLPEDQLSKVQTFRDLELLVTGSALNA